ncbi:LuxR C-terminal-related transcriptional regulator [Citrobacter freundii]
MKSNRDKFSEIMLFDEHKLVSVRNGEVLSGPEIKLIKDGDTGYLVKSYHYFHNIEWRHVTIFSSSMLVNSGIQFLLAKICPVKLQVFKFGKLSFNQNCDGFIPDLVFWILADDDDLSSTMKDIIALHREKPQIRHIIMGNRIPQGICKFEDVVCGVTFVNSRESLEMIISVIERCLNKDKNNASLFYNKNLTRHQLIVLSLMSLGYNSQQISHMLSISIKTVSTHQLQGWHKLNVNSPADKLWLSNVILSFYSVYPFLKRKLLKNTKLYFKKNA